MTLLVTGAMGHAGSTLVRRAAAAGIPVIAQYRSRLDERLAATVPGDVRWQAADLADPLELATLAGDPAILGCIHAAAVPNDRLARPRPWAAVQSNVTATAALLEMARVRGWRRFLLVSTSSVFQDETDLEQPILEDHPTSARTVYGTTKRAAEMLTSMYRAEHGVPAATVRISWVYGPPMLPARRDPPRGPIPAFVREALQGIPVREPSGGDFAASFTHVEDVAAGLLAAFQAEKLNHDVYHLGSGRNHDTREVAAAVCAAVPGAVVEVGPGTLPWTTYNTLRGPLAGERLLEDTGFRPRLSLLEGVRQLADWARNTAIVQPG
jgi:UDP-glucuronate 4-epimerase